MSLTAYGCGPSTAEGPHEMARPDMTTSQAPAVDLKAADISCGGQLFQADRIQPNVFLVLDRSGSMGDPISDQSSTAKWDDLKGAMTQLITTFDSQIRLGMSVYNRDGNCSPGIIDTALAPMQGATVVSQLAQISPSGNTPTAATLDFVRQNGGLTDTTRTNVVVLATDGLPNCNDKDVEGKITALYNATPSVKTFVIGIGSDTASNPNLLNSWAVAGHTDRAGTTKYFQSNSAADLDAAFQSIVNGVVSCSFALSSNPPDPSQLYVWLAGTQISLDPAQGYTYSDGPATVTLNGTACDTLKSDPTKKLQIVYGCPTAPIF